MHSAVEHYIQRDILRSLSRAGQLTFSRLQPEGIENGIFGYHLKQLLHDELITKQDGKYLLTIPGIRYVSQATRTNIDLPPQPKLFCLLIIENDLGEFILHRRNAEPFLGSYTFPGGALFFGEDLSELIARQLREKTGLDMPMDNRGIASLRLGKNGQVLSHTYAHIFYHRLDGRPPIAAKDRRFIPEWINPSTIDGHELLPDIPHLIHKVKTTDQFFFLDLALA